MGKVYADAEIGTKYTCGFVRHLKILNMDLGQDIYICYQYFNFNLLNANIKCLLYHKTFRAKVVIFNPINNFV